MAARLTHRGSWLAAGFVLVATLALVPAVAQASGGGGCGQAVTDRTGTQVQISGFCFGPTITRVDLGAEVTFTNLDPVPHSILGANGSWGGYDALKRHQPVTYRFSEAGVYPYVCTFHIGMVGVVVVGDGIGGAIDTTTKDGPVTQVEGSSPAANVVALQPPAAPVGSDRGAWPVVALAAFGLLVLAAGGILVARRRRGSVA